MSGDKKFFQNIEETPLQAMRLGEGNVLQVAGVGSVALYSSSGKTNILTNDQYMPNLAHNLLSVGQLMSFGYNIKF